MIRSVWSPIVWSFSSNHSMWHSFSFTRQINVNWSRASNNTSDVWTKHKHFSISQLRRFSSPVNRDFDGIDEFISIQSNNEENKSFFWNDLFYLWCWYSQRKFVDHRFLDDLQYIDRIHWDLNEDSQWKFSKQYSHPCRNSHSAADLLLFRYSKQTQRLKRLKKKKKINTLEINDWIKLPLWSQKISTRSKFEKNEQVISNVDWSWRWISIGELNFDWNWIDFSFLKRFNNIDDEHTITSIDKDLRRRKEFFLERGIKKKTY